MAIEALDPDEFGPAMLALDERQRKFVLHWIANGGRDAARAARDAGYSDVGDGSKVRAHRLLRSDRVRAALKEESERDMGVLRMMAVLKQKEHLRSSDMSVSQKAIDSVLDRTGLGRTSTQDIRVEHVDSRSTAELLAAIRGALPAPRRAIEGEFEVVSDQAAAE